MWGRRKEKREGREERKSGVKGKNEKTRLGGGVERRYGKGNRMAIRSKK